MAIVKAPAWQWPKNTPQTQNQALTWTPYEPQKQTVDWSATGQTAYSGAEQGAIAKLAEILKYGGYSPEQKQTMLSGAMQPVYQQAEEASRQATGGAYARGLGQSGVLQRSLTDIQKGVGSSVAQLAGQIEQQGAAQILPAIGAVQTGQQNLQQMMLNQAQYNANLAQQREQLAAQLNMKGGDLEAAIAQINATLDMSDADRQVRLAEIMNQFNLDATKLEVLQREAQKNRIANFFGNLLGGGANVLGAYLGGLAPAAGAAATTAGTASALHWAYGERMAGPWDALGEGISRGVSAYLAGREMQERRKTEKEEKARELERWLYSKMQTERAADMGERQFQFEQEQAEAARAEAAAGRVSAEKIAGMRAAGGQEQERPLYDNQGFNGEVALWMAMKNLGVETDVDLAGRLSDPQYGQARAEGLVNRLASVHGWRYPERNLSADFWAFLKVRNPNLKSPSDMAAAQAAQQQGLAQQQAERERRQQELAVIGARPAAIQALPSVGVPQPQTPEALQQALVSGVNPRSILASPGAQAMVRQALQPQALQQVTQNVTSPQQPTPAEQAILDAYRRADPGLKLRMEEDQMRKQVLDRFRSLL